MRIDAFLQQSPIFAISHAGRRLDALAARALAADGLSFLEGLVLAAIFFEAPRPTKPSHLAAAFDTTRGNISHCLSSLEAKTLLQRRIDPEDARGYQLVLKPAGKRCAMRVIAALDALQRSCEQELGKILLQETIKGVRRLEAMYPGTTMHPRPSKAAAG